MTALSDSDEETKAQSRFANWELAQGCAVQKYAL